MSIDLSHTMEQCKLSSKTENNNRLATEDIPPANKGEGDKLKEAQNAQVYPSETLRSDMAPRRQDITMSEYLTALPTYKNPWQKGTIEPDPGATATIKPEDASPRQRKRVSFDTPISTVPSTPMNRTPASSPTSSASSANSSHYTLTAPIATPTTCSTTSNAPGTDRPALQRSSSTSSHPVVEPSKGLQRNKNSYRPPPPVRTSSSYGRSDSRKDRAGSDTEAYARRIYPIHELDQGYHDRRHSCGYEARDRRP